MANHQVIVLGVIAGAGAAVLCGYAITRFYFKDPPSKNADGGEGDFNQAAYMREVRLRNQDTIAAVMGLGRRDLVRCLVIVNGIDRC